MISIVVSVLNEEKDLRPTFNTIMDAVSLLKRNIPIEIIIVNDGSTDGTAQVIDELKAESPIIQSISFDQNQGLGTAFLSAAKIAKYDKITIVPGDNAFTASYICSIIENVDAAEVVFSAMTNPAARTWFRRILSNVYNFIYRKSFDLPIQYIHGTPIYPTSLIRSLKLSSSRYAIFSELAVKALRKGLTFCEINGEYQANVRKSSAVKLKVLVDVCITYLRVMYEIHFLKRGEFNFLPERTTPIGSIQSP